MASIFLIKCSSKSNTLEPNFHIYKTFVICLLLIPTPQIIWPICNQNLVIQSHSKHVATPLWAKCEGEAHTPKSGNLESSETPENSELELKGQNTSHWSVLGVIGKVLKCRCLNWPRIGHLDICSPSYGQKKAV
jgi:hypothetical protein